MGTFVFNCSKGRVAELYNRVDSNDPANSALIIVAINRNSETDATLKDMATLAAILGSTAKEVTNTNYARKTLTDTDLGAMTPDNTNDQMPLDFADQTWAAVLATGGTVTTWTDLLICYDNDTTTGTDSNVIPLSCHAFAVTPDGTDIVAQVNNFYIAS